MKEITKKFAESFGWDKPVGKQILWGGIPDHHGFLISGIAIGFKVFSAAPYESRTYLAG